LELIRADALKFAATVTRPYDLVFLDPPYYQGWLERMTPLLEHMLTPDARVYVEAEQAVEFLGSWQCVKRGQAGQVFYQLLELPCPIEPPSTQVLSIP
jgi:16S rRNA (guanine966-N2)-methyltransferase